jgi:hypothetical protein
MNKTTFLTKEQIAELKNLENLPENQHTYNVYLEFTGDIKNLLINAIVIKFYFETDKRYKLNYYNLPSTQKFYLHDKILKTFNNYSNSIYNKSSEIIIKSGFVPTNQEFKQYLKYLIFSKSELITEFKDNQIIEIKRYI